jgi:flagellar biosynthesis/type III secretory pathway chaperone
MAKPTTEQISALRLAIERETAAFALLVELLQEEQRALITAQPDGLPEIVTRKNRALDTAAGLDRERLGAMAAAGLPRDPRMAEMRLARHPLGAAFRRLRELARNSRVLNDLNGRLAGQKLKFVSARLDALRGAAQRAGVYDASGRSGDAAGSTGRVIAAV